MTTDAPAASSSRRLSRRDRTLLALGALAWIVLLAGGAWFVHRLHAMGERCRDRMDSPADPQASNAAAPAHGLRILTLPGLCK